MQALAQPWKSAEPPLDLGRWRPAVSMSAKDKVVINGELGKYLAAFRDKRQPSCSDAMCLETRDASILQQNLPANRP